MAPTARRRSSVSGTSRPQLREVVDVVCDALALEPWDFESRPKSPCNVLARRLTAWVWVHHLGGKLIDVARELRADERRDPLVCARPVDGRRHGGVGVADPSGPAQAGRPRDLQGAAHSLPGRGR